MKLIYSAIITLLFLNIGFGQQTPEDLIRSTNSSNTIKSKPIYTKNRQVNISEKINNLNNFETDAASINSTSTGTTPANFSVSLSGSATYDIPIATPTGIRDITPDVSLNFNSQASNGLAGWGWGISGLSAITKVSATKFHDGYVDGVNFNKNDRFSLDGQRLILKTGVYGEPNSTYQTEMFSNIKVKAIGTSPYGANFGPSHFIVYYPNGTRVWYGTKTMSKNRLEWAITKKIDPQGNKIEYDYTNDGQLRIINKIRFGHRDGVAPNEIKFNYKKRQRPELFFIEGRSFKRTKILSNVETKGNGKLFRSYDLTYNTTYLGYERLVNVTEKNNAGKNLAPIKFNYGFASTNPKPDTYSGELYSGYNYKNDQILSGEFNGDGVLDFILYNDSDKNNIRIFDNIYEASNGNVNIGRSYDVPEFDYVLTNSMLNHDGKKLERQGITFVKEKLTGKHTKVEFKSAYSGAAGLYHQYTKTWNAPTSKYQYDCDNSINRTVTRKYVSGDFNGDGLTDVLALDTPIVKRICFWGDCDFDVPDDERLKKKCCNCEDLWEPYARAYFIDLNRNLTTDFTSNTSIREFIGSRDKVMAADFNGDGKTNLFHFQEGSVYIYELDHKNKLRLIHKEVDDLIKMDKPILLGDYNGDGKIDFLVPTAHRSNNWKFFLSRGTDFLKYTKELEDITYSDNQATKYYQYTDGPITDALAEFKFITQDINGDGKTDIIKHFIASAYSSDHKYSDDIVNIHVNIFNQDDDTPTFKHVSNYVRTNTGIQKFGVPIFLETHAKTDNIEYAYISANHLSAYKFEGDHRKSVTLKTINNNGKQHKIEYSGLTVGSNYSDGIYTPNYDEVYPYVNINTVPSLKLVSKVQEKSEGFLRTQDFRYGGAVSHATGLGILGFKRIGKSNVHGNGVQQLWTIIDNDIQKRGAPTKDWVTTYYTNKPEQFASKNEYLYETKLTEDKVFINVRKKIISEDALVGVTKTKIIEYDSYYSPHTTITTFPNGSETIKQKYIYKPEPFDETYTIGRLSESITKTVLNGDVFSTTDEYIYDNNLVTEIKKQGNNTDWLYENYDYDDFGNVIEKKISGKGITDRVEKFKFDPSGRFLIESIDNETLKTTYKYDFDTGTPLEITNSYGLPITYIYDDWGRIRKEVNHLGKRKIISYMDFSSELGKGGVVKHIYRENGTSEYVYYNALGWVVKEGVSSINNKLVYKEYKYDVSGKKIEESEPFFDGDSPTKWNTYSFDEYGRPISQQHISGRIINTKYDGLSATVNDGNKTVTSTKDALGNIVSVKDEGGTINYTYYANGTMKSTDYGGHIVKVGIDGWGRKKYMTDPSAGTYTYKYNILGDLLKETTPKGVTEYKYNKLGKIINKKIIGDNTNIETSYEYDPDTKLLKQIKSLDSETGKKYSYVYTYDDKRRIHTVSENTGSSLFQKELFYDDFGRISKESYSTNAAAGVNSVVSIKNVYDTSGILKEVRDFDSNNLLWRIDSENAQGKALQISLGNEMKKIKEYDDYGYLKQIFDRKTASTGSEKVALKMDYNFDAKKGVLDSRKNHKFNNWEETFTHDNLNRLIAINGSVNQKQEYDKRGRIKNNSWVGVYNYTESNVYRLQNIDLNNQGDLYYQQNSLQQITYNAYKKPSQILKKDKGRVDFEYGPFKNRTHAYYGGTSKEKEKRKYHKYYSSIIPVEVVENKETGSTKIISYISGDAYTAPIVHIKQEGKEKINGYYYLHRDYLGSILAISDSKANIVEERQFGAWGSIDQFRTNGKTTSFAHNSILSRGFTGHEHFFEVGLIHMNGRMYNPKIGRFLSPDNFIQDPYSTQSFNRYGYVWNNPLSFNDPSGEIVWAAVLVGAIAGAVSAAAAYAGVALQSGNWDWGSFGMAILGGALVGGVTYGIAPSLVWSTGSLLTIAAGGFVSSFLPTFNIPIGDWNINVSASVAFGNASGIGTSLSVGYNDGKWSFAAGIGYMNYGDYNGFGNGSEIRKSIMAAYDDGKTGYSLGTNWWSGDLGGGDDNYHQQTGMAGFRHGDFKLQYENDGKPFSGYSGDGNDQYRTAALHLSVGDYSVGFNLFTGQRTKEEYKAEDNGSWDDVKGKIGPKIKGRFGETYKNGLVKEEGTPYRLGALTFGYQGYRIGVNSDWVRHAIQNVAIHGSPEWLAGQRMFEVKSDTWSTYSQYKTTNKFTSW